MMPITGLSDQDAQRIRQVLEHFPEIETATLFGSRAKGTARPGSDIDLSLSGSRLDLTLLGRIHDALDDLLLPFEIDLVHQDSLQHPDLMDHIRRVGMTLYQRKPLSNP